MISYTHIVAKIEKKQCTFALSVGAYAGKTQ